MNRGHGKTVMAVMVMVMAVMACSVKWEGVGTPSPSMTAPAQPKPSMTATLVSREAGECLIVQAIPGAAPGSLNLRSGPGTEYSSITVLSDGQLLTSSGLELEWYSVTMQGNPALAGYVNAAYVEACP